MSILALTSNTLSSPAGAGNLEYNGQFYATDTNASRAQLERIVQSTAVASTSGTSIDFTSIPSWAKRITIMFAGVSTNGTSIPQVQIGSGSVTTTGYVCASTFTYNSTTLNASFTTGFGYANLILAANILSGHLTLTLITGNTWVCSSMLAQTTGTVSTSATAGYLALGGALDRVRITTVNGTDTFDAGSINIMYEG